MGVPGELLHSTASHIHFRRASWTEPRALTLAGLGAAD